MTFPVELRAGALVIPAHLACEALAYFVGFRAYLALRKREGDALGDDRRWTIVVAAAIGAALGSKLLAILQHAPELWARRDAFAAWASGKTLVGGLAGGTLAVEGVKRALGERRRTGDLFVLPLALGMAIGRVGCFLAGPADHTAGGPTTLPWGVDFGDGVRRHPVPLYEILALAALAAWSAWWRTRAQAREGDRFRGFLFGYALFRFATEFLKPDEPRPLGLSAIQIACLLVIACYARDVAALAMRSAPIASPEAG